MYIWVAIQHNHKGLYLGESQSRSIIQNTPNTMQIIAIKVELSSVKRRRKALKLAAGTQGVESVGLNGEDEVIVTGDEVDPVCLTNSLRKKFGYAKLLSLQHLNPDDNNNGGDGDGGGDNNQGGNGEGNEDEPSPVCPCNCCQFPPPPPCPTIYYMPYDADPYPPICSIM